MSEEDVCMFQDPAQLTPVEIDHNVSAEEGCMILDPAQLAS